MRGRSISTQLAVPAIAAVGASFVFNVNRLPEIDLCLFHRATGRLCGGCGMTRAFCAISHGDLGAAWGFNPFSFVFYAAFVFMALLPLLERRRPSLGARIWRRRGTRIAFTAVLCSMAVFGLWRVWSP